MPNPTLDNRELQAAIDTMTKNGWEILSIVNTPKLTIQAQIAAQGGPNVPSAQNYLRSFHDSLQPRGWRPILFNRTLTHIQITLEKELAP